MQTQPNATADEPIIEDEVIEEEEGLEDDPDDSEEESEDEGGAPEAGEEAAGGEDPEPAPEPAVDPPPLAEGFGQIRDAVISGNWGISSAEQAELLIAQRGGDPADAAAVQELAMEITIDRRAFAREMAQTEHHVRAAESAARPELAKINMGHLAGDYAATYVQSALQMALSRPGRMHDALMDPKSIEVCRRVALGTVMEKWLSEQSAKPGEKPALKPTKQPPRIGSGGSASPPDGGQTWGPSSRDWLARRERESGQRPSRDQLREWKKGGLIGEF